MDDGTGLFIGNASTVLVKGVGDVVLKFTSGKVLTFTNVYYVLEVRKNLVLGSSLLGS